jgi:hypothetical protein
MPPRAQPTDPKGTGHPSPTNRTLARLMLTHSFVSPYRDPSFPPQACRVQRLLCSSKDQNDRDPTLSTRPPSICRRGSGRGLEGSAEEGRSRQRRRPCWTAGGCLGGMWRVSQRGKQRYVLCRHSTDQRGRNNEGKKGEEKAEEKMTRHASDRQGQLSAIKRMLTMVFTFNVSGKLTNLIALCPSTGNWRKTVIDLAIK